VHCQREFSSQCDHCILEEQGNLPLKSYKVV
jgi:hypothetical protein